MAKKPSFDTAKIKDFLFQKGERLGLGLTAGITLLLLVMTFLGVTTRPPAKVSADTWPEAFTKTANATKQMIVGSQPRELSPEEKQKMARLFAKNPRPAVLAASDYPPLQPFPIDKNDKKRLPPVMPVSTQIADDSRDVQVDVLPAPTLVYGVDFQSEKIDVVGGQAVKYLEPHRLVVVTATFPYQEQLKLYAEALQYAKLEDLLKSKDLPRFLGLDILRFEMVPGETEKQYRNRVDLYVYDQEKQKAVVHKPLDYFFRRMVIDAYNPAQFGSALAPNMVTPVPFLAAVTPGAAEKYPKLKITGFEQPEGTEDLNKPKVSKGPGFPAAQQQMPIGNAGMPGGKGGGASLNKVSWSKLADRELGERLRGNYNVFNPFARPEGAEGTENRAGTNFMPNFANPSFPNPNAANTPKKKGAEKKAGPTAPLGIAADAGAAELPKLLVRFIDIDLEVGKTYRYFIQVRMANPTYGHTKEVASEQWASSPELVPSGYVATPPVTVPGDIHYYAYDQVQANPHDSWPFKADLKWAKLAKPSAADGRAADDSKAAVQIHRWINRFTDSRGGGVEHFIGDWVVAERLLVRRGDPLGREVYAEVPEWNERQGTFVLGRSTANPKQKHKPEPVIPVDFRVDPAPLLVDFQGGSHDKYRFQKGTSSTGQMRDNAELELLILDENGKLVLRKSHDDAADPLRLKHYARWSERLAAVRKAADGGKTPGPGRPGLGGPGLRGPGLR